MRGDGMTSPASVHTVNWQFEHNTHANGALLPDVRRRTRFETRRALAFAANARHPWWPRDWQACVSSLPARQKTWSSSTRVASMGIDRLREPVRVAQSMINSLTSRNRCLRHCVSMLKLPDDHKACGDFLTDCGFTILSLKVPPIVPGSHLPWGGQ